MDIVAEKRTDIGKKYNLKLRAKSKIPAVIYFSGSSIPIFFDYSYIKDIISNFYNGNNFFDILVSDKKYSVILKDFYKHPCKDQFLHLDFQKVESNELVKTKIFFKFTGEKNSLGIKHGGFLIKHRLYILVKCLKSNIPNFIEIDVTNLGVNKSIFLSDLCISDFLSIPILNKFKGKVLIASIVGPRAAEQKSQEQKTQEQKTNVNK